MTIKEAREAAGLTQQQLAEKIGVTQKDISRWENGARFPSLKSIIKVSNALNVTIEQLISQSSPAANPDRK